ncbi:MAG: type II toxin-antitoxin system VapC family toxin [Chloroflexota bacterium]|nr:type II toxin-antitoxin system VapC family toxin [Chloroflexota bacterium]
MIVVDANIAVKWVLPEELTDRALAIYADATRAGEQLIAPSLLVTESINAIFQHIRRGVIEEVLAIAAVGEFQQFLTNGVDIVTPSWLATEAFAFAREHALGAIYDSLYVVLARQLGATLWTADRRLVNTVAVWAPWVRWLGEYESTTG